MKYPIGIQTFAKIREGNFLYFDKTALIHQLAKDGGIYFLSRPRRFGKSLLITTLEAYFQGRKNLFEGLEICQFEKDWHAYPVLHIDLNARDYSKPGALRAELNKHLEYWEKIYGKEYCDREPEERFQHILSKIMDQTGQQAVILVDEYDKPLLETFGDKKLQEEHMKLLKAFYGVAKTMDSHIRFALFTGVTKFSKVSVFSDLNNLNDISLDSRYAEICGITEQEIRDNIDPEIEQMATKNSMGKEECYEKLRKQYDGYHFSKNAAGVYNPFSLLCALDRRDFGDYWFETGTPTFLVETLKHTQYDLENLTKENITAELLGSLDSIDTNPVPLLYQSGYLTIQSYNPRFMTFHLGFPNEEVERGFTQFLFRYYAPSSPVRDSFIQDFVVEAETGRVDKFMRRLEALLAGQDYQIAGDAELYFHNIVALIFKIVGFYTETERHTSDGRMDMVVQTKNYIYIFEFKLDESAEEALNQIEQKQYDGPFASDPRMLFKIGVNFSSKTRRIESWIVTTTILLAELEAKYLGTWVTDDGVTFSTFWIGPADTGFQLHVFNSTAEELPPMRKELRMTNKNPVFYCRL